jgi:hypothetical protein
MKELMCMFTLREGFSGPWNIVILVFTVSNNTQIWCIAHPFVISPEHNKKSHLNADICELMHFVLGYFL